MNFIRNFKNERRSLKKIGGGGGGFELESSGSKRKTGKHMEEKGPRKNLQRNKKHTTKLES